MDKDVEHKLMSVAEDYCATIDDDQLPVNADELDEEELINVLKENGINSRYIKSFISILQNILDSNYSQLLDNLKDEFRKNLEQSLDEALDSLPLKEVLKIIFEITANYCYDED